MSSKGFDNNVMKCQPFVCVLKSIEKSFRCDFCFKSFESNESIECNVCHKYWYCSESCCNEDSITHWFDCNSDIDLRQIIADKCNAREVREESDWCKFIDLDELVTHSLVLLKILFKLKSEPNCETKEYLLSNQSVVTFADIPAPECKHMHKVWDEEGINAELIDEVSYNFGAWLSVVSTILDMDFIKSKLGSVSGDVLMRVFIIVVRYTLYVLDNTFLNEIGKGIYIEMCFITHSCVPNCGPLFDGTNTLDLRLLDENIKDFGELRYDFQIEMSAFSAQELSVSLFIRNIDCKCKKCLNRKLFTDFGKQLKDAKLKYGNWNKYDYCQAMSAPIDDALNCAVKTYGKYHPLITGLLLWKLGVELVLMKCEEDLTKDQFFNTFKQLKNCVYVTHGLEHRWFRQLSSMEESFKQFVENFNVLESIENTLNSIIPWINVDKCLVEN